MHTAKYEENFHLLCTLYSEQFQNAIILFFIMIFV